jgi:hypothetical protein
MKCIPQLRRNPVRAHIGDKGFGRSKYFSEEYEEGDYFAMRFAEEGSTINVPRMRGQKREVEMRAVQGFLL